MLCKKAEVIVKGAEGRDMTAEERKTFDAAMAEIDRLGAMVPQRAGPNDGRSLEKLMADAQKIQSRSIVEDVGERVNVQGTQGRRGRDPQGNEFRVWSPDEAIAPYAGTGRESEARMNKVLAAAVTGRMDELTAEERNLSQGSLASGGVLIPTNWSREIIQGVRANLTAARMADIVEVPNGNITIPGVSGFPTASWVGESGTFTETDSSYFALKLLPKKVGTYTQMSVEMVDNSSGLEGQLDSDLNYAVALAIDKAFYEGDGVNKPLGLKNSPYVNSTDAAGAAITLDNYTTNAYWALQAQSCPQDVFMISNPKWGNFLDLVKLAGAGLLYAFSGMPATTPSSASNITKLYSAALRNDTSVVDIYTLPRGCTVLGYNPNGVRLEIFRGSDTAITKGQVFIRIYMYCDAGVKIPAWVHVYKNVNAA
jgi:HK97 family phage major capsid protein